MTHARLSMKWLFSLVLFVSFHSVADVSPERVVSMLDQMVEKNVISKEEALKAKARLQSLSSDQWIAINRQAEKAASRSPASASAQSDNKIEEVHGIDLDSVQFKQIQSDLEKIVPKYKD
jgi:membrane peptidoglycan carboxypeptidase